MCVTYFFQIQVLLHHDHLVAQPFSIYGDCPSESEHFCVKFIFKDRADRNYHLNMFCFVPIVRNYRWVILNTITIKMFGDI